MSVQSIDQSIDYNCVIDFYARKQLLFSARLSHRNSVRLSVCPSVRSSVCHTGGSI